MFKILDYYNPEWQKIIELYKLDIYFAPQYCKIWEDYGDGEVQAFLYKCALGEILYPYLIRKIDYKQSDVNYFDISTPYGYGGPVLLEYKENEIPLLIKTFRDEFNKYAHKKGIISEFIRFHPVYKNYKDFLDSDIQCKYVRNTVEMNLTLEKEEILKNMDRGPRAQVKRAIGNGLNVVFKNNPTLEDLKLFYKIYSEIMNRVGASDYYKFSLEFILNTFNFLKGSTEIAFIFYDNTVISAAIFILANEMVHGFLGGSLTQYLSYRPNSLMYYTAALRYQTMGKKCLHLGGGYSGNDSLFRFKKGFNENGILDFFIGTQIFNEKAYNLLVNKWRESNHLGKDFRSDFFPLYRLQINEKKIQ